MTRLLAAAVLALAAAGCLHKPYAAKPCDRADGTGCIIQGVSITGNHAVPSGDVTEKIATAESSHALGGALENVPVLSLWDRLTVDYERLDRFVLERDLTRVERLYRARGYYDAHARAARVFKDRKGRVRVEIVVDEGAPVVVDKVAIEWKGGAAPADKKVDVAAEAAISGVTAGAPLVESSFEDAKPKLVRAMTDRGFAYATVEAKADVDLVTHRAIVTFTADPGPPTTFGAITIEGADELPRDRLRHVLGVVEGTKYSTYRLEKAQASLSDLHVVGSVDAVPKLEPRGAPDARGSVAVPVTFRLTSTTLKTVKLGFGAEAGTRVGVHGVASWENRNFFGGLRSFTIEGKPGIVFFPFTLTSYPTADFAVVPELRVHTALVQPGFIEAQLRGLVSADVAVYQLQPTATLGYLEAAVKTGVSRDFWNARVNASLFANVQFDQPLLLQIPGLALLPSCSGYNKLIIPYAQIGGTLDYRYGYDGKRDSVNPHYGFYVLNDVQVAAGPSDTDIRFRPDLRFYIPVTKRLTIALRLAGGILHPFSGDLAKDPPPSKPYDPTLAPVMLMGKTCPSSLVESPAEVARSSYIQLLQIRGFTSGGSSSNRGYGYSAIGPQEQVPRISAIGGNNVPLPLGIGGKALWEASVELRIPIYDKLGATVFLDGSDVRNALADFGAPFAPHLSTGLGVRYMTPVGPLRADIGVRIPGAQVIGSRCPVFDPSLVGVGVKLCDPHLQGKDPGGGFLDPSYGQAGSLGHVPIALSLAIGEAF